MLFFRLLILAGALFLSPHSHLFAQHIIPVNFWLNPQLLAPTAMGASNYIQVNASYQKQALIGNLGSRSLALNAQAPLSAASGEQYGMLGLGIVRDESGASGQLSTTAYLLSYNYTAHLSSSHHLVAGIQAGYYARRLNWRRVTTGSQYADGQHNPDLDNGEQLTQYESQAFTTNLGLAYYFSDADGEPLVHLGAGMLNANKGKFSYLEDNSKLADPMRWVAYADLRLMQNHSFALFSRFYWMQESGTSDFVGGLQFNKALDSRNNLLDDHFGVGAYYSPEHHATLSMQLAKPKWVMAASYSIPLGGQVLRKTQSGVAVTLGWRMQARSNNKFYRSGNFKRRSHQLSPGRRNYSWNPKRTPSNKYHPKDQARPSYKYKVSKRPVASRRYKAVTKTGTFSKKKAKAFRKYKFSRNKVFRKLNLANSKKTFYKKQRIKNKRMLKHQYNGVKFKKWKPRKSGA